MLSARASIFVQVAESGSFAKAAAALFLSPVAVMKQVNSLEARVGVQLLNRSNRGVQLTEAGALLYREIKSIAVLADSALDKARSIMREMPYVLRVGTSMLYPCKPLLTLWNQINDAHREFRLRVIPFQDKTALAEQIPHSLGSEFDFFVGPLLYPASHKGRVQTHRLCDCRLGVAVPYAHRLSSRARLSPADLAHQTLCMPRRGVSLILDGLRSNLSANCPGLSFSDTADYYSFDEFNRCEQDGALLLTPDIWKDAHPALRFIPVDWAYTLPYGLLHAAKPSIQVQYFLETLELVQKQQAPVLISD